MSEIVVVAEQRDGELREITLQMLHKAAELCRENGDELCAVVLGSGVEALVETLSDRVDRLVVFDDPRLRHFDPDAHSAIVARLVAERKPLLTLLGHTPWTMDLVAALAVKTGYPLATDCVDIMLGVGEGAGAARGAAPADAAPLTSGAPVSSTAPAPPPAPRVVRQIYGGKLFARMAFREAPGYLISVRAGAFPAAEARGRRGEVVRAAVPPAAEPPSLGERRRESLGYIDTCKGEVDIAQAELLVSVGRGIGDEDAIPTIAELARLLGGTLSCSRPVVDKKWLPKYHQVGTSGKSVKPKVYLALGISGAFQHVAGISGAGTVIAVNKDKKAPIFRVADYGALADLEAVVAALAERVRGG